MNFGFGSSKPKKVKVAAKPPGAESKHGAKLVRVRFASLISGPSTSRGVLSVILCIGIMIITLLLPRVLSLWNTHSWTMDAQQRLRNAYTIHNGDAINLYRATTRKGDDQLDPKATLFATALVSECSEEEVCFVFVLLIHPLLFRYPHWRRMLSKLPRLSMIVLLD